ncbi:hypothetical protein PGT21_010894 [Puccinia graminis f. sp. tritici]|uniref:Uncharacterized protein n=1 Tax=Puccinia graminis f. sp. tritici TaxID=56615 RepID=A0A5B0MAQ0_PUCGR|nr:hypothetical protein PGT21_010894 [Puccinia graminis f. sp. tritici]
MSRVNDRLVQGNIPQGCRQLVSSAIYSTGRQMKSPALRYRLGATRYMIIALLVYWVPEPSGFAHPIELPPSVPASSLRGLGSVTPSEMHTENPLLEHYRDIFSRVPQIPVTSKQISDTNMETERHAEVPGELHFQSPPVMEEEFTSLREQLKTFQETISPLDRGLLDHINELQMIHTLIPKSKEDRLFKLIDKRVVFKPLKKPAPEHCLLVETVVQVGRMVKRRMNTPIQTKELPHIDWRTRHIFKTGFRKIFGQKNLSRCSSAGNIDRECS